MHEIPGGTHSSSGSTAWFSYIDESPSAWQEALQALKRRGVETLRTPVLWGAHEALQGARDFTKCSRLRLERFFTLAHAEQLKVDLILGFPPARETFPAWSLRLDRKAWIPSSAWPDGTDAVSLTEVPSLFDPQLLDAFVDFLQELAPLLSLYRAPEGPLERIHLDLGVFRGDLNAMETQEYVTLLASRYGHLEAFNQRFQSSFRHFSSAGARHAFRVLSDRRAWLAAFDYKWCRDRMLAARRDRILAIPALAGMISLVDTSTEASFDSASWGLAIDPTLLEASGSSEPRPFSPGGYLHPTAIQTYRLARYLSEHCEREGAAFRWLPLVDKSVSVWTVICGKYLSREAMTSLREASTRGVRLFFPFGLPQYDEDMSRHDAFPASASLKVLSTPLSIDESLWENLSLRARALLESEPVA